MATYSSYYDAITHDELLEGLLGNGLFSDKIPPVFTGEAFSAYLKDKTPGFPKKDHYDYVRYESMRNINVPRAFAIPNPIGYYHLVSILVVNWDNLKDHVKKYTHTNRYKVSKVHLRKRKDSSGLFKMTYKTYEDKTDYDVDLLVGKRYMTHADISNCFPSIYSHSIPWALVGKKVAKKNSGNPKLWQNKIDFFLRNTKNQETNGILIGPHSSNLISELVLIVVDAELLKKGYNFIRFIDDYTCYTEEKEQAEKFLVDLSTELKNFELNLNHKKSKISELPRAVTAHWVRKLKNHRFKHYQRKNKKWYLPANEIEQFLDLAIELMHKEEDNSAILNYAFQMLSKKRLHKNAVTYLVKRVHHLCFIYPYLVQFIDDTLFEAHKVSKSDITEIANSMYQLGLKKRLFEACSYSIYFALKYNFKITGAGLRWDSFRSEDCVFMTLSYLYDKKNGNCLSRYYVKALMLQKSDFDRYWLFVYEVLPRKVIKNPYKILKKNKVSFIRPEFS